MAVRWLTTIRGSIDLPQLAEGLSLTTASCLEEALALRKGVETTRTGRRVQFSSSFLFEENPLPRRAERFIGYVESAGLEVVEEGGHLAILFELRFRRRYASRVGLFVLVVLLVSLATLGIGGLVPFLLASVIAGVTLRGVARSSFQRFIRETASSSATMEAHRG